MRIELYAGILAVIIIAVSAIALYSTLDDITGNIAKDNTNAAGEDTNIRNVVSSTASGDPFLGPEDAKVVVIEYSDFECPYCAAAAGTHEALIQRFKSSDPSWEASVPKLKELALEGKIKIVYKDFPLSSHRNAQKAAEAGQCANEQGMFWEYHDAIFENQAAIDVASLKQYASDLGLDIEQFNGCLDSGKYAEEVQEDFRDGQAAGVSGTPTFFVNGQKITGAQPFSAFESVINRELELASSSSNIKTAEPIPGSCTTQQNCGQPSCAAASRGGSCGCGG